MRAQVRSYDSSDGCQLRRHRPQGQNPWEGATLASINTTPHLLQLPFYILTFHLPKKRERPKYGLAGPFRNSFPPDLSSCLDLAKLNQRTYMSFRHFAFLPSFQNRRHRFHDFCCLRMSKTPHSSNTCRFCEKIDSDRACGKRA